MNTETLLNNPVLFYTVIIIACLALLLLIVAISKGYNINYKNNNNELSIEKTDTTPNNIPSSEHYSGFIKDYESATDADKEMLTEIEHSVDFLGVSGINAYVQYNRKSFSEFTNKNNKKVLNIRFLLLNPNSKYVHEHAKREKLDYTIVKNDILTSVKHLIMIREQQPNFNIEIRFYDEKPFFRLVFINKNKLFMGYYGYTTDNPCISFIRTSNGKSFYYVMENIFETIWDNAIHVDEKMIKKLQL